MLSSSTFKSSSYTAWHGELLCNLMNGWKPTRGRGRLQMLDDLYENNGYEVLKRTAEDRSAWKESTGKKAPKTCCLADN